MSISTTCRFILPLGSNKKKLLDVFQYSKKLCQTQFTMDNKPVEKAIQEKLKFRLNPTHLQVINESFMHNVPKGSETHFKVFVVSQEFEGMALLKRHRLVNSILEEELKNGVHALSIVAKAPSQWNPNETVEASPKCLGGFGK